MSKKNWSEWYAILKHAEGGLSQKDVEYMAKQLGLEVEFDRSIFVGHYSVRVNTQDKRKLARFEREIFGI